MEAQNHIHTDTSMGTFTNIILISLVGFFEFASTLTAEDIYTWSFRSLSLISLVLIIIINWRKAMDVIFKRKQK